MARISQLTLIFRDKLQTLDQNSTKDVVSLNSSANNNNQSANLFASWPSFQIPLHYPKFTKEDYEVMSEDELNRIFKLYGMPTDFGDLSCKRQFAIGAFLWEKQDVSVAKDPNSSTDDSEKSSLMGFIANLKHMVHYIFRV